MRYVEYSMVSFKSSPTPNQLWSTCQNYEGQNDSGILKVFLARSVRCESEFFRQSESNPVRCSDRSICIFQWDAVHYSLVNCVASVNRNAVRSEHRIGLDPDCRKKIGFGSDKLSQKNFRLDSECLETSWMRNGLPFTIRYISLFSST